MFDEVIRRWREAVDKGDKAEAERLSKEAWRLLLSFGTTYSEASERHRSVFGLVGMRSGFGRIHAKGAEDDSSGVQRPARGKRDNS